MMTCIVSGPKRSGTTLLNRLFDTQPGMIDMNDEAFFWEHAYRYAAVGREDLFLDLFRAYSPADITDGMIERDLLPWIEGRYQQAASFLEFEVDLGFNTESFRAGLKPLRNCATVQEVWHVLVDAYASASDHDYSNADHVLIKSADYGMSILGGRRFLDKARFVFVLRNPFYALDSLKKSRQLRGSKLLNPFNFGEALRDYVFFWDAREDILGEDTIFLLYEDLLASPRTVMKRVASHLGVPFTENLLQPTLEGKSWHGLSSFQATHGVDSSVLERPLQVLEQDEIELVRKHLSGLLERYGYGPAKQMPVESDDPCVS
ncbi:MAG: sulfotransferase [Desulfobacteraceae bacterium]|jgi:hypothetical protein